ncbi:hypothetical protein [Bacillus sp. 3255]|uniref:hypothetical protein n=1 Tax=Bacillus sp. 3255 TaxID=2817904 RepID=UPI00285C1663|nr:hypothetical protein [Bacillus sp. 3255]MDR6880362.1 hypothetical protein [Bacillus sp. 3255]
MKTLHRSKSKHRRVDKGPKALFGASATISAQAQANLGTPVYVVLKDGSFYYGILKEIGADQVILQGFKGNQKISKKKRNSKVHISGLGGLGNMLGLLGGGGLGGLLGGGLSGGLFGGLGQGAATNTAGVGGLFSNLGSFMKLGMGVISFITPLMKNFSI